MRKLVFLFCCSFVFFSCFQNTNNGLIRSGADIELDHNEVAHALLNEGDPEAALSVVNNGIEKWGIDRASLRMRMAILIELEQWADLEKDAFLTLDVTTRNYYMNGESIDLFVSAYCFALLSDENRSKSLLHLLKQRDRGLSLVDSNEKIDLLVEEWAAVVPPSFRNSLFYGTGK